MLTVHTTTRVLSTHGRDIINTQSPYTYCPLQLLLKDGSKYDWKTRLNYYIPHCMDPTVTSHSSKGIMHTSDFVNWKKLIDLDPLPEEKLHNCDHIHIDGEFTYYPTSYGKRPKVQIIDCRPYTTWPTVAQVGQVIKLDRETPCIAVEDYTLNDAEVRLWPGSKLPCYITWEKPSRVWNWLFADWGQFYVGRCKDLGWTDARFANCCLYVSFSHLWESNTLKTMKRWFFVYHPNSWSYDEYYYEQKENGASSIYDFEEVLQTQIPDPGLFRSRGLPSRSVCDSGLSSFDAFRWSESVYNDLDNRFLTDDVSIQAGLATAKASQTALLETKALDINSIMYLRDFTEIGKLIRSYTDLVNKGINPKTVSGAYLASYYGVRLTVKDSQKIIKAAKRLKEKVEKEYAYAYGREYTTCDNGVRLKANVSIAYSQYDCKWLRFLSDLSSLDVLPTPSRIWDMIAYTFVVDWFIPIGDMLEVYDALTRWVLTRTYRACCSVEATVELDSMMFNFMPSVLSGYGYADFVHYKRNYQANPPFPLPWLDIDNVDASWNAIRFLNAGALIAQRI